MKHQCPLCDSPSTNDGQPSNRQFYACGSYGYHPGQLSDTTEECYIRHELQFLKKRLWKEIIGHPEHNPSHACGACDQFRLMLVNLVSKDIKDRLG